jgi:hypothetical protein
MKNVQAHIGRLQIIERMKNSLNGNPRYRVLVGDKYCVTATDSSIAYGITNHDGRQAIAYGITNHDGRQAIAYEQER